MKTYFFSIVIEIDPDQDTEAKSYKLSDFDYENFMFYGDFIATSEEEMEDTLQEAKEDFEAAGFYVVDAYTEIININTMPC